MPTVAIVGFFAVVALIVALTWYTRDQRTRRALARTPRATIASFPVDAPARIVGRIVDGEQLTSPLTRRACVFYEAIVEQHYQTSKSGGWREVIREVRGVPFVVDDGTGHAWIDPTGAALAVVKDSTSRSGSLDDATAVEEAFLERHQWKSKGWLFNKTLRYREGALEIGETVAIAGLAEREVDPDGAAHVTGYRDAPPPRLRLTHTARVPLLISDFDDTK